MATLAPEGVAGVELHGPRHTRRWLIVGMVVAVAAVLGIGGLAVVGSHDTSTDTNKATTVDHQATLAEGETPGIASQLTVVPGYRYVDVPAAEVKAALEVARKDFAELPDIRAASFHGVVADDESQNTAHTGDAHETGYLELIEFVEAPPAGVENAITSTAADTFAVGGTTVWVTEQPDQPDSRYLMTWLRHGVLGVFDGADRAPVERWTRAYLALPERQPKENDRLAASLVDVSGYAYTNWWEDSTRQLLRSVLSGGTASSAHAVADSGGVIGGLLLAEAPATTTLETLASAVKTSAGVTPDRQTISGLAVLRAPVEDVTLYVWVRDGIAGEFVAYNDTKGVAFLGRYLAA